MKYEAVPSTSRSAHVDRLRESDVEQKAAIKCDIGQRFDHENAIGDLLSDEKRMHVSHENLEISEPVAIGHNDGHAIVGHARARRP